MRRHTLILLAAAVSAVVFSLVVLSPVSQANDFYATNQQERETYAKRQYTINRIVTCLNSDSQAQSINLREDRSVRYTDVMSNLGNSFTCDVFTNAGGLFADNSIPNSLKMPATEIIGDAMTFLTRMGYQRNSDGTQLVLPSGFQSYANWGDRFLQVYNDGKSADLNNPEVRYVTQRAQLFDQCNLLNPITVASIDPNSENGNRLSAARNNTRYDGNYYTIVKSVSGTGTTEVLYHLNHNLSSTNRNNCRDSIAALNTLAESVAQRTQNYNNRQKDDALVASLKNSLCPASHFVRLVDPSVSTTNTAVDTEAQEACFQKIINCTVAEGPPQAPQTDAERKDCLIRQFPDRDIEASYNAALVASDDASQITVDDDTGGTGEGPPDCGQVVDGIGWMVCPLLNAMGNLNDWMWNIASDLLQVNPLRSEGQASEEAVYTVWSTFRNIANALLIVVFIIIIYGQITGGLSNYNIKKMLPRVIVMAIAINLSFFIIAILVDVFNIFGQSLYGMLTGLLDNSGVRVVPTWDSLIGLIVGAGAGVGGVTIAVLAAGGAKAALIMALPAAAIAFLGFLAALLTLMVRQAIIPVLAILAPLAFVAYILPNTEQWFKKWWSMLISMLALYPLAALLFGGVQLSAWVVAGDGTNWISTLIALIMMGAPLFLLPFLARQSGPMLSKLNGAMNGMAGKLRNPLNSWAKPRAELAKTEYGNSSLRTGKNGKPILRDRLRSSYQRRENARRTRELRGDTASAETNAAWADQVASNTDLRALTVRKSQADLQKETAEAQSGIHAEVTVPVEVRLQAKLAKDQLQLAKSETDQTGVEAAALAAEAMRTGNTATAARAAARAGGNQQLANTLSATHTAASVTDQATSIAKRTQQEELARELRDNDAVALRAAGIGGQRALSGVRATAKSTVDEASTKAIAAEKSLLSTASANDTINPTTGAATPGLVSRYQDASLSDEARAAAIGKLMKVGTDQQIYEALNYAASMAGTETGTLLQQQLATDMGSRKPVSIGGAAMGQLETGAFSQQFSDVVAQRLSMGKIGATNAATATNVELQEMVSAIRNMPVKGPELQKLKRDIEEHLTNPNIQQPTPEIAQKMEDIANSI